MRQDAASNDQEDLQDHDQYSTGRRQHRTRPESSNRVTVYEAADVLGVTVDAIRKRIQRGTIPHERHEDGRVYVLLDEASRLQDSTSSVRDSDQDGSQVRYRSDELVESLQDQVEFLRRELERKDAILLRMAERIPELEAAPEPREARETATQGTDKGNVSSEPEKRRSWLYRFFLGT